MLVISSFMGNWASKKLTSLLKATQLISPMIQMLSPSHVWKQSAFLWRQPCLHQRNWKFTLHKLTYTSILWGQIHFLFWLIQISFLWNKNSQNSCQLILICAVLEQSGLRGLWYKNTIMLKYIYYIDFFPLPPPIEEKWHAMSIDMLLLYYYS